MRIPTGKHNWLHQHPFNPYLGSISLVLSNVQGSLHFSGVGMGGGGGGGGGGNTIDGGALSPQ